LKDLKLNFNVPVPLDKENNKLSLFAEIFAFALMAVSVY
jgi:hypothetical protein